ncbi:hypothetical protein I656_02100 [Geobacillus sp. WSUCF1]|nr:hypothetical protein I656_02100 [Geobacillus sp. WSUCF1]
MAASVNVIDTLMPDSFFLIDFPFHFTCQHAKLSKQRRNKRWQTCKSK